MSDLDALVEKIAEGLWQADSERAAKRRRLITWQDESEETRKNWRFAARAALSSIDSSGTHVVVPVEPTAEMIVTADAASDELFDTSDLRNGILAPLYRAMLSARPKVKA